MSISQQLSSHLGQLDVAPSRIPSATYQASPGLVPSSEQVGFTYSIQPLYPPQYEEEYEVPSLTLESSVPTYSDQGPVSLSAGPSELISVGDLEDVELDAEVWIPYTYYNDGSAYRYYTIQVPGSSRNELIASGRKVDDIFINLPDANNHGWPILTSKKHRIHTIPAEFKEWMHPIQHFLAKSAEYLRPYKNYVQTRRMISNLLVMTAVLVLAIAVMIDTVVFNDLHTFAILIAAPFYLLAMLLSHYIKKGLADGFTALKLCGKYEKSVLPDCIKVILGPYGTYWKFVLEDRV